MEKILNDLIDRISKRKNTIEKKKAQLETLRNQLYGILLMLGIDKHVTPSGNSVEIEKRLSTGWIKLTPEIKNLLDENGVQYEEQFRSQHIIVHRSELLKKR